MPAKSSSNPAKPRIFAYLRRSTNKEEQKDSLAQQEDGIWSIIEKLSLDPADVAYFTETRSGFENKRRKEWGRLIEAIDRSPTPCILLARDLSRLSRNPKDSLAITDRLYGDNGSKRKIERIHTLDFEKIRTWDCDTDKEELHKALSGGFYDSIDTRRKSIQGILLKLQDGQFPYAAPKGLETCMVSGRRILKQSEVMPVVRRAFEMKSEGKSHKEISSYLKRFWGANIWERDLSDRLFKNQIYIGRYVEKNTGQQFASISFLEGRPPISLELWEKVQRCLGRKISQYGDWQKDDVIAQKLRTEGGKRMSKYLAKGKYAQYKNTIEKIHIGEKEILQAFISELEMFLFHAWNKNKDEMSARFKAAADNTCLNVWVELIKDPVFRSQNRSRLHMAETLEDFTKIIIELWKEHLESRIPTDYLPTDEEATRGIENMGVDLGWKTLREYINYEVGQKHLDEFVIRIRNAIEHKMRDTKKLVDLRLWELDKMKRSVEQDRKEYRVKAIKMDYTLEEINETTKDFDRKIADIDLQIQELSETGEMEKYLQRLPEILRETFELASSALSDKDAECRRDNLMKLIELTTFELTVNNKKELKVKLFDVLDALISRDESVLEAPSGVEPLSTALQAAV